MSSVSSTTATLSVLASRDPRTVKRILFLSVGGSCIPLVHALKHHRPDHVVFVCSANNPARGQKGSREVVDGEGPRICHSEGSATPDLPNIRVQAHCEHLPFDLIELAQPDHLEACHRSILEAFLQVRAAIPDAAIVSDYTGGTKTMSAALAAIAVEDGRGQLSVVTGNRSNLQRVTDGTHLALVWDPWGMHARRRFQSSVPALMASFDYAGIRTLLSEITSNPLPSDLDARIRHLVSLCNGFEAWDRFDHLKASQILGLPHLRKHLVEHVVFLEHVIASRRLVDDAFDSPNSHVRSGGSGFEIVQDLILNAERCAIRGRYDDAVGRLYRATELFAQIHLRTRHGLATGDLEIERVPETARAAFARGPNGRVQTGVRGAYELLRHFPDDPVGKVFADETTGLGNRLVNALQIRNQSLFAHGFRPLTHAEHVRVLEAVRAFIEAAFSALGLRRRALAAPQFPVDLLASFPL
jgi:CRISPR-associated protein (TIGR02710 family)